jgi:hypothetical protein
MGFPQPRGNERLALESPEILVITREEFGQELECDITVAV